MQGLRWRKIGSKLICARVYGNESVRNKVSTRIPRLEEPEGARGARMGKGTGEVIDATVFAINGKWKQLSCLVLFGI